MIRTAGYRLSLQGFCLGGRGLDKKHISRLRPLAHLVLYHPGGGLSKPSGHEPCGQLS